MKAAMQISFEAPRNICGFTLIRKNAYGNIFVVECALVHMLHEVGDTDIVVSVIISSLDVHPVRKVKPVSEEVFQFRNSIH